jgi:hypothetical protein
MNQFFPSIGMLPMMVKWDEHCYCYYYYLTDDDSFHYNHGCYLLLTSPPWWSSVLFVIVIPVVVIIVTIAIIMSIIIILAPTTTAVPRALLLDVMDDDVPTMGTQILDGIDPVIPFMTRKTLAYCTASRGKYQHRLAADPVATNLT